MSNSETKRVVGYELVGDGVNPGLTDEAVLVRMPIEVELTPGRPMTVNLGIQFDRIALLYPVKAIHDNGELSVSFRGTVGSGPGALLIPGLPVVVDFEVSSRARNHLRLDEKETVVLAVFPGGVDSFQKKS